jgi:antitoxin ParD1/3/4
MVMRKPLVSGPAALCGGRPDSATTAVKPAFLPHATASATRPRHTFAKDRPLAVAMINIGKNCQVAYHAGANGRFAMPTRNVNLTAEQDAFIEEVVRAGRYQNASEAMRDAVRGLQQRLKTDELKLDLLRTQVKAGLDALDRGAFTEVDDADLNATLDRLAANGAR